MPNTVIEKLRRSSPGPKEGSVFGYRCLGCSSAWKVYQTEWHSGECPNDPRLKKGGKQ